MKEFWKIIEAFEEYYVSNLGRVKRIEHETRNRWHRYSKREKILKPFKDSSGYDRVKLYNNGVCVQFSVHRLMMEAFVPNPENLPCVNHKDENRSNNFIWVNDDGTVDLEKSNLEWCTVLYNNTYGTNLSKRSSSMINKNCKTIIQYDLDGNFIKEWPSAPEIKRQTGYSSAMVTMCCNGKVNKAGGFIWKYK